MGAFETTPIGPRVSVLSTGLCVPERIVNNAEISDILGVDPEWVKRRTGISERRYASEGEAVSDLVVEAATQALQNVDLDPREIDLLILATSTPDHLLPPTAPLAAHRLGLDRAGAFDLAGACTGFLNALAMASAFIESGRARYALSIGANILSRRINSQDRNTYPLFGDGAGALLLGPSSESAEGEILAVHQGTDGAYYQNIYIPVGGSREPYRYGYENEHYTMRMDRGDIVYREAIRRMSESLYAALERSGLTTSDLDWLIPHQANERILNGLTKYLTFPMDRVVSNLAHYGNTSAASIPMALHEAASEERLKRGDRIGLVAFGAGFTYGSAVLIW